MGFTYVTKLKVAYEEAVGIPGSLVGVVVGVFVGRLDWLSQKWAALFSPPETSPPEVGAMIFGFPSWIVGITVFFAWMFFLMWRRVVKLNDQIKDARLRLSELRREGVELRKAGKKVFLDNSDWADWKGKVESWNEETIKQIGLINKADAEWFAVLDIVPPAREKFMDDHNVSSAPIHRDRQKRLYERHDFRVMRLGEMIYHLWGK